MFERRVGVRRPEHRAIPEDQHLDWRGAVIEISGQQSTQRRAQLEIHHRVPVARELIDGRAARRAEPAPLRGKRAQVVAAHERLQPEQQRRQTRVARVGTVASRVLQPHREGRGAKRHEIAPRIEADVRERQASEGGLDVETHAMAEHRTGRPEHRRVAHIRRLHFREIDGRLAGKLLHHAGEQLVRRGVGHARQRLPAVARSPRAAAELEARRATHVIARQHARELVRVAEVRVLLRDALVAAIDRAPRADEARRHVAADEPPVEASLAIQVGDLRGEIVLGGADAHHHLQLAVAQHVAEGDAEVGAKDAADEPAAADGRADVGLGDRLHVQSIVVLRRAERGVGGQAKVRVGEQMRQLAERAGCRGLRHHARRDDRRRLRACLLERLDLVAPVAIRVERELPAGRGDGERRARRRDAADAAGFRRHAADVAGREIDAIDVADAVRIRDVVDGLAVGSPLRADLLSAAGRRGHRPHDLRRDIEQGDADRAESQLVERRREPI